LDTLAQLTEFFQKSNEKQWIGDVTNRPCRRFVRNNPSLP